MNNIFDRLSNHISVQSDFQFSINIEYDLNSDRKIKNYIPTPSAVDIIEDVMLSTTASSTDRARVFVGAYGKGKSHLALMLLALLCRKDKSLYADLLSMICETKPDLCRFISDYQNSEKKLLPVVIQGSSIGIRQAFLLGIRKALQANNLDFLMPNTYFTAAIEKIDNWKSSYKVTYNEFKNRISCSVSDFKAELAAFNTKYYERFVSLYPELTSGSEFNPTQGLDIVELYNDVNKKIKDYGFTGIYVVYDEFSKFLTGNLKKTSSDEVEVLQYFAENCNRSGKDQMHIMLISHQSILNYVDNLPKTKMDSWRAVADRYKTISLNNSSSQMYSLTAHVIKQEPRWFDEFKAAHANELRNIYDCWRFSNAFHELDENEFKRLIYLCYPLHPITTFFLPRISEKVAQNERTLFTFLSADGQRNTLPDYLNKTETEKVILLTPDIIYDYFEPLFKAESYNKPIHKIWKTSTTALSKINNSSEIENRIVKIIALINILDHPELLPPTTSAVMHILENQYDSQSITTALTNLTNEGIIRQLDSNHYLRIAEHTDENIGEIINNRIVARSRITDSTQILNAYVGNKVFYPNGYNDEHEITRFFELHFADAKDVIAGIDYDEALQKINGDGIVYAVITDEENRAEAENTICRVSQNRIMFILSSMDFDVERLARKFDAIKNILATSEDDILKSELAISLNDLDIALKRYVDSFIRPEYEEAAYYIGGEKKILRRRSNISRELSAICENTFTLFPTINNEAINKNDISKQAVNSRIKVVDGILSNITKPNLGLKGTGQDVSFMRSTLRMTGILCDLDEDMAVLKTEGLPNRQLENVLDIIRKYIIDTAQNGRTGFLSLYDQLTNPEHHIGLKKGVIPIYLAVVLHGFKKHIVITKNNKELEISALLLESINNKPQDFCIELEEWDNSKEEYIHRLEEIFSQFIRPAEKEYNSFEYVVHAMQRWYLQLPKYVKETKTVYVGNHHSKSISRNYLKFLNSLKNPEINAKEYLFEKVFSIFGYSGFSLEVIDQITVLKRFYDNLKRQTTAMMAEDLKLMFKPAARKDESLFSIVSDWTESLDDKVRSHLFNKGENALLDICYQITHDRYSFVEQLGRAATGLRIDDWADVTMEAFFHTIEDYIVSVVGYSLDIGGGRSISGFGSYKVGFVDENGNESFKTFDKTELSFQARLLFNDIETTLNEEYGDSLSKNEKRQVLMEIIQKTLG